MNTPDFFTGSDGRTVTQEQVIIRSAELDNYRRASLLRFQITLATDDVPEETPPTAMAVVPCADQMMVAM